MITIEQMAQRTCRTTIEQMVQREVLYCMSSLVSTLASGAHWFDRNRARRLGDGLEAQQLCIQAAELAAPVLDYEEAAVQGGYRLVDRSRVAPLTPAECYTDAGTWEEVCTLHGIDPYEWEVYEHWAVTQWLAEKLQAQGERVDTDFAGLNIWARTTTGQAISMDGVVQKIYREMVK